MQRALEHREEQGRREVAAVIEAVIERRKVLQELEDELRQGRDKLAQLEVTLSLQLNKCTCCLAPTLHACVFVCIPSLRLSCKLIQTLHGKCVRIYIYIYTYTYIHTYMCICDFLACGTF
jgi:hypothetical protein